MQVSSHVEASISKTGELPVSIILSEHLKAKLETPEPILVALAAVEIALSLSAVPKSGSRLRRGVVHLTDVVNCAACGENAMAAHHCSMGNFIVHEICGRSGQIQGYGAPLQCYRCTSL